MRQSAEFAILGSGVQFADGFDRLGAADKLNDAKKAARRCSMLRRAAAADALREARAGSNLEKVLSECSPDNVLAGYIPVGSEISPIAAMQRLAESGRRICVPVVKDPDRHLRFREWSASAKLIAAAHGIPIPETGDWLQPDILVVPLLAFDNAGFRLGYGGGYYDRTLTALRQAGSPLAIGFAYDAQRMERVPTEEFDQRLDMLVTEEGVFCLPHRRYGMN